VDVRIAAFDELDAVTLYGLLRLRSDVFVVEQHCVYPDLDGRDLEPGTRHGWLGDGGRPAGYLRILREPDGTARIGRVCVAPEARGTGVARRLMVAALEHVGGRPCALDAQTRLVDFYAGFGFVATGPEFDDDGIMHIPMARPARAVSPA
jgi:ElaA protein